jgi:hypothetical protein
LTKIFDIAPKSSFGSPSNSCNIKEMNEVLKILPVSFCSTWICDPKTTPEQKAQFLKAEYEPTKKLVAGAGLRKPEYWQAELEQLDKLDHVHKELAVEELGQLKGKGLSEPFDKVGFCWLSKTCRSATSWGRVEHNKVSASSAIT